jgi:phospholipase/carboxylesterase
MHFLRALPGLYGADLSRTYAMGFSQGAALSFTLALQHPGFLQGIAGLVGFVPEDAHTLLDEEPLLETPVFMAAGREDERVPIKLARRSADILREAEADLTYREYDTGHKINSAGMRDLAQWWALRR